MKFYAGIGSRNTPQRILSKMIITATLLAEDGWTLRSGGAIGADTAFEEGCDLEDGKREIFKAKDAEEWAYIEAKKHIPKNRPAFHSWSPYARSLIARNMMQILGRKMDEPVTFVLCWSMANINDGGGTGYGMRCAMHHNIPVFNLYEENAWEEFKEFIKNERKKENQS